MPLNLLTFYSFLKSFLTLLNFSSNFLPVSIRPHAKYGLRLRNHGGRTSNGDGGTSTVKGPDGTTFTFTSCSLSFNGTNPTRGQVPQVLYFSTPQESGANDVQVRIRVKSSIGKLCKVIFFCFAKSLVFFYNPEIFLIVLYENTFGKSFSIFFAS